MRYIERWSPPPTRWVKCNHDATYQSSVPQTGSGWIIRNANKEFECVASSYLPKAKLALEAEGFSLLHAMQIAWYRGFRWIIFECDSKLLVELLHNHRRDIAMDNLLNDIKHWCNLFAGVQFVHIGRKHNVIPDKLASHRTISICFLLYLQFSTRLCTAIYVMWLVNF